MPTLEWIGKDKVINHDKDVPFRILDEKYSYGEDTGNKIIHGDNLEALKSLLPQYDGKIKCIYIDPPYNTGNENWIYNDNVSDPKIKAWLGNVVGKEGEDLSRHDKWLCMMYPRLKLLHRLLANDGVIFISIDDNEQANLKLICDEIFGKNNFLSQFCWKSDGNFDNQAKIKVCHEYIICYQKNISCLGLPNGINPEVKANSKIHKAFISNTVVKNGIKNPISQIKLPIGFPCEVNTLFIEKRNDKFPRYLNDAIIKDGVLQNAVIVESGWSSKDILLNFINNDFKPVIDTKGQETIFEITSTGNIYMKKKRTQQSLVMSVLSGLGSTQSMSTALYDMGINFDFPKPINLIEYLLNFYCTSNDIVLDSFAGSGTTAHAVLNMNKQDGGNRKFILVEMEDYAESITAERVRRVIDGYGTDKNQVEGTGGGFTYYELGEPLFKNEYQLNEDIPIDKIYEYVWYMETNTPYNPPNSENQYYLGEKDETSYYFYYKQDDYTVLDMEFLSTIKHKTENYVIYADKLAIDEKQLQKYGIIFKKIPRDISKL